MNTSLYFAVILGLLMFSCHQKKATSNLVVSNTGSEQCSNDFKIFLDLPVDCQVKILSLLDPRDLVKFTKTLSKEAEKIGYKALINQARSQVPEVVQLKIESYLSHYLNFMGSKELEIRKSLLFIEKLLVQYLTYLKLMHGDTNVGFRNYLVTSQVSPIALGDTRVAYISKKDGKLFLEIRDAVTTDLLASKELASGASIRYLRPMGSRSFVSVDENENATVWTLNGKDIVNQGIAFPLKKILNIGQLDGFFVRNNGKLIRYFLIGTAFEIMEFGPLPPALSSTNSPEFEMFATKPDQIITLTAIAGKTNLQSWKLSENSISLKREEQFGRNFKAAKALNNELISFVIPRDDQYSIIIYDSQRDQGVLHIEQNIEFNEDTHYIDYFSNFNLVVGRQISPEKGSAMQLYLYKGTSMLNMASVKEIGGPFSVLRCDPNYVPPSDAFYALPFDAHILALTNPAHIISLKNPEINFEARFVDPYRRPASTVLRVPLKDAILTKPKYMSRNSKDFNIVSIWKSVMDAIPELTKSSFK